MIKTIGRIILIVFDMFFFLGKNKMCGLSCVSFTLGLKEGFKEKMFLEIKLKSYHRR